MSRGRVSWDGQAKASSVTEPEPQAPVQADLTKISLAQLRTVDSPVLAECLARILRESRETETPTAEFNSAV
ncbi:MAG: FxSxx-COOH cyclophane-containing RiPP peptide [Streptosporangiaceae bacterium]